MALEFLQPPEPPRPFVGRKDEMERLRTEVYGRERRYPDMPIVITGEAGIGKTALAAEFVERRSRRERSIWIQCRDWEMTVKPNTVHLTILIRLETSIRRVHWRLRGRRL